MYEEHSNSAHVPKPRIYVRLPPGRGILKYEALNAFLCYQAFSVFNILFVEDDAQLFYVKRL
jgi:hypothetical protein